MQDCGKFSDALYFQTMILRCCAARSVRQRVFPSAATETIGRTKLPSSVCHVTLLHTELGSLVRPIVSAAADGKTRWRTDFHRRRNIEVFEICYFFNITIEIARAYGKFSNLKIVEVMCMHLGCISKLS